MPVAIAYPRTSAARDRFVLDRRGPRPPRDPWRHQGAVFEHERGSDGQLWQAATVFLTGRECPWRCVMCDLWRDTTSDDTPRGALVQQLEQAMSDMRARSAWPSLLKLYNAGSFFDPRAVPVEDHVAIARIVRPFRQIVIESHPLLVAPRLQQFLDTCRDVSEGREMPRVEVAIGLETAHPDALDQLHKRFTLDQFAEAAAQVRQLRQTGRA